MEREGMFAFTPWHEAGHFVVAELTGLHAGVVTSGVVEWVGGNLARGSLDEITYRGALRYDADVLMSAGGLAGALIAGQDRDRAESAASADLEHLRAFHGLDFRAAWHQVSKAMRLLDAHSGAFRRVAWVLQAGGRFTGEQLRAAMDGRLAPELAFAAMEARKGD